MATGTRAAESSRRCCNSRAMKLAVYHDLPSGGAKRVVYEVVQRLAARWEIDVYSLSTANESFCDVRPFTGRSRAFPFEPARLFESPFGRLNQLQRMSDLRRLGTLGREIAAEIDAGGYDAVWVHPCMWLQAPHVLRRLRTPSSFYVHEPMRWAYEPEILRPGQERSDWRRFADRLDPMHQLYRRAAIKADRENLNAATEILANSSFTAANVAQFYGRAAEVCYPGVDTELFAPLPQRTRAPWVLSVGEIRPSKGFDFLIEALSRIPAERRPPLRLVGNAVRSEEVEHVKSLASDRGVLLEIETNVGVQTLVERYNEAAMVVYAPIREPLGLVPLEALACETPVVGVAEGGVRETVADSETGLLTERDPQRFAAAVEKLLGDPELRDQLGREGRRRVLDGWSWDRAAEQIEASLVSLSEQSKERTKAA
jgi:glycosyltransferase involved in cell wall biosynthesis